MILYDIYKFKDTPKAPPKLVGQRSNDAGLPQQLTEPQQTLGRAPASPLSRPLVQSFGILLSSDANTNRFGQIICL